MWPPKVPASLILIIVLSQIRRCDPKISVKYGAVSTNFSRADPPLVVKVISALDKLIRYYEENHQQLNLDGIFGAKVIEGQLNLVVAKHNKGLLSDDIDYIMKNELSQMAARAGRVVRVSLPYLYKRQPLSMRRLQRLFHLSWDMGHSHRKVDLTLLWDKATKTKAGVKSIAESDSDRCISEVLEPVNGLMCAMSTQCQELMTLPGHSSYSLTRQILYSIVAEMSGCGSRLEQWVIKHKRSGSLEQLQAEMCANLYPEACVLAQLTHTQSNPANVLDTFIQMGFVCGMLGYSQFLQEAWMMDILARQDSIGCYKDTTNTNNIAGDTRSINSTHTYTRLLSEIMLKDGCLAHLTGVAASSLAVHLHSLLQEPSLPVSHQLPPVSNTHPPLLPLPYLVPPNEDTAYADTGIVINKPLFRGDIHSGLNRIADNDKSLEDKADILMQRLEAEEEGRKKKEEQEEEKISGGSNDGREEEGKEKGWIEMNRGIKSGEKIVGEHGRKEKTDNGGKVEVGERNWREEEAAWRRKTNHEEKGKERPLNELKNDNGMEKKKLEKAKSARKSHLLELPYMAVPLTFPSASLPPSPPSPFPPLWLAGIVVVVVVVSLGKYAQTHTRRRRCKIKGKFWL